MEHTRRKSSRLKGFDYNTPGAYFVTICTYKMRMLFWEDPTGIKNLTIDKRLNFAGQIADEAIKNLPKVFPLRIEKYVIMPNHIHLIILLTQHAEGKGANSTLCRAIGYLKRAITLDLRKEDVDDVIWHRSFYDHIIPMKAIIRIYGNILTTTRINGRKTDFLRNLITNDFCTGGAWSRPRIRDGRFRAVTSPARTWFCPIL